MVRTSIYDRISAKRIALEEAARKAEQEAPVVEVVPEPEPEPVVPLRESPSSFSFGGFNLAFPEGFRFRDIQTTVEHEGSQVMLSIKRRDVMDGQTLDSLFGASLQAFRERDPELRVIRRQDSSLAGSPAKTLDFFFKVGTAEHHARLVGAVVPVTEQGVEQWLEVSCLVDPVNPQLSLWLTDFDRMLDRLAAH
ncbi:DcrB-related protein [Pseudomonas alliivorans]|nr:DcrB-related protein [Pseudomonas alliivorans]